MPDAIARTPEDGTSDPQPSPTRVLVVDDTRADRRLAGTIIEQTLGWNVIYADNGRSALEAVQRDKPHLVVTDLVMPEMDGLDLVSAIRRTHPLVPVVLMTVYGNEEVAIRALQNGAASYVPKRILDRDLARVLEQVLAVAQGERRQERLLGHLRQAELHFCLGNDPALAADLVGHLQQYLQRMDLGDHTTRTRVGVALEEALLNAIYHGNLEISSGLRQQDDQRYYQLAAERRGQSPYQERRVYCTARFSPEQAIYIIRDEGSGFDPSDVPDPTEPENLEKTSGRGLLLIRTFMDEVSFNEKGNEITLIKRREPAAAQAS